MAARWNSSAAPQGPRGIISTNQSQTLQTVMTSAVPNYLTTDNNALEEPPEEIAFAEPAVSVHLNGEWPPTLSAQADKAFAV